MVFNLYYFKHCFDWKTTQYKNSVYFYISAHKSNHLPFNVCHNSIFSCYIQYLFLFYMFPNNRKLSWSNWFVISKRTSYRKSCQANDTCYENHHSLLFSFLWWWVLPLKDWCVFRIFSICMEACDDHIFTFAVGHSQWFIRFPKFNISWMYNRNPYLHSKIN